MINSSVGASFRDPSGYVFEKKGVIYRNINPSYQDHYEYLIKSKLYKKLVDLKLLIPHLEVKNDSPSIYKTIRPKQIPFISYPYEWCFSQLKAAALTTLKIQKIALEYGMILKDASSFNIQYLKGKPILIDTLSFERYNKGQPWVAYRQFCMHFIAPLLLMKHKNVGLNRLLQIYMDGIPLDLASNLLPLKTWLQPKSLVHLHLHAKSQDYFKNREVSLKQKTMNKLGLNGLIDNLQHLVKGINFKTNQNGWTNYYKDNNYTKRAFENKMKLVLEFTKQINPKFVWDLGANTGEFSHLVAKYANEVISLDSDPLSVEANYLICQKENLTNCLPLTVDLTNPAPNIGWENQERMSFIKRGPADLALALALLHHLAIANNIPFEKVAGLFSKICKYLIIEFAPKEDSQVQRLLKNRRDIFDDYQMNNFEKIFSKYFLFKRKEKVKDSLRILYLMEKR